MIETVLNRIKSISKDSVVAILMHPYPDPDCLGAAFGVSTILSNFGVVSKIYHLGEISHPQNKTLRNILKIPLCDGRDLDSEKTNIIITVDTDLIGTGLQSDKLPKADLRIDHHAIDRGNEANISDVRPVGATCSIIWEYFNQLEVSIDPDVAAALLFGIKTDTLDFTSNNTSDLDIEAFSALIPVVNKSALASINKYPLPKTLFDIEFRAWNNKKITNTVLTSFVGELTPHSRDAIPTIADRFVRTEGIDTAIIMGVVNNDMTISVRSTDNTVDVNEFCVKAFGKENAGGKEGSGGARFSLGPSFEWLENKETRDKVKEEIVSNLEKKISGILGSDTE